MPSARRQVLGTAVLILATMLLAAAARAEDRQPRVIAAAALGAELAREHGDVIVHFTLLDPSCPPCTASNTRLPAIVGRSGFKGPFLRVQWVSWDGLGADGPALPLAERLMYMPMVVRFRAGREIGRYGALDDAALDAALQASAASEAGGFAHAFSAPGTVTIEQLRTLLAAGGDTLVHFTSLDQRCSYCVASNVDFPERVARDGWKGRFVQVTWMPWENFPPELATLPLTEPLGGVPTLVRFHDGHEVARVSGVQRAAIDALLAAPAGKADATAADSAGTTGPASAPAPGPAPARGGTPGNKAPAAVVTLTVEPRTVHAMYGGIYTLRVVARDAAGVPVTPTPPIQYLSSAPDIVSVEPNGRARLLRRGKATVRASAGSVSSTIDFDVMGFAVIGHTTQDYRCALPDDRLAVYCWGKNLWTIPLATTALVTEVAAPTAIARGDLPPGTRLRSVASGGFTTCALAESGSVYCWGNEREGTLGRGTPRNQNGPQQAARPAPIAPGESPAGAKFVALGVGLHSACAATDTHDLYCWGWGGTVPPRSGHPVNNWLQAPVAMQKGEIPPQAAISEISLNVDGGCVLAAGEVYCWSGGASGPQRVPRGERFVNEQLVHVETDKFACALADSGAAYCAGAAFGPRFGNGTAAFLSTKDWRAVHADAAGGFTRLALGGIANANCAIDATAGAWCWGPAYLGGAADGNLQKHELLVPARALRGEIPADVRLVEIGCGEYHCTALGDDGRLYGWGANYGGVLGRPAAALTASARRP